jgi:phage FluMu protein Com
MSLCRKCNTTNEEGLTRCKSCNAILPVKLGSQSEVRFERVRRQPDLVGVKCPQCETMNPYTCFRCKSCNTLLSNQQRGGSGLAKVWLFLGAGAVIIAVVVAAVMRAI